MRTFEDIFGLHHPNRPKNKAKRDGPQMDVLLFTRPNCPKCPAAKKVCEEVEKAGHTVKYIDAETVEGMADAAYYEVMATPTIVVVDNDEEEVISWRGEAPPAEKIIEALSGR